ncbi:uncharacterized protein BDZ83DRAFT_46773 [Colletotrichum acutatum]|uniref:Uncharacterized protein n=1 Tax=Glomerella acutata TaxID=27357 RepID=A0AAD8UEV5_GLOAC|nr:uncharacterized protein BDZ83DRAFT_46773 [Colletotrichum acutatum]KAK1716025.1 hypothetical protein BDZ83DRAFT_46773 [Colletotrichum acutatum]
MRKRRFLVLSINSIRTLAGVRIGHCLTRSSWGSGSPLPVRIARLSSGWVRREPAPYGDARRHRISSPPADHLGKYLDL